MIVEGRFEEWLQLFDLDGHYWIALSPQQTDAALQQSILYEDTVLLRVRVQRFSHPRAHLHQPHRFHRISLRFQVRGRGQSQGRDTCCKCW
ncbi:MAG: hypothetical protein EXR28_05415 [Betaproteobacteria bacterium]|nr:hypothetical protein [Betaproteobacteria bacterium]